MSSAIAWLRGMASLDGGRTKADDLVSLSAQARVWNSALRLCVCEPVVACCLLMWMLLVGVNKLIIIEN